MPLREIRRSFCRSEIVLMSWRSQELSISFKKRAENNETDVTVTGKKRKRYWDAIGPERMPDKYYDENGDFNLSKVTGEEGRRYFEGVLRIPMPPGVSKMSPDDDSTRAMKQAYGRR